MFFLILPAKDILNSREESAACRWVKVDIVRLLTASGTWYCHGQILILVLLTWFSHIQVPPVIVGGEDEIVNGEGGDAVQKLKVRVRRTRKILL